MIDAQGFRCIPSPDGHCITCSDEALPAQVVALQREQAVATVEAEGERLEVATDLLDDVVIGDVLLVHAGVALARLEGVP